MSSASKIKGSRIEREIRDAHLKAGVPCKKMPLSGALGGEYAGDLQVAGTLLAEVKARKNGIGFTMINKWMGNNHILFLRENNSEPKVVLTWDIYIQMLSAWCKENGVPVVVAVPENEDGVESL